MSEYKLYKVYHLSEKSCWNLRVAQSPEEALTHCINHPHSTRPDDAADRSCRAEEVKINGYTIKVTKDE